MSTSELRIQGRITVCKQEYISAFCHGCHQSICINVSCMTPEDREKDNYIPVFNRICCKARRKHVII